MLLQGINLACNTRVLHDWFRLMLMLKTVLCNCRVVVFCFRRQMVDVCTRKEFGFGCHGFCKVIYIQGHLSKTTVMFVMIFEKPWSYITDIRLEIKNQTKKFYELASFMVPNRLLRGSTKSLSFNSRLSLSPFPKFYAC